MYCQTVLDLFFGNRKGLWHADRLFSQFLENIGVALWKVCSAKCICFQQWLIRKFVLFFMSQASSVYILEFWRWTQEWLLPTRLLSTSYSYLLNFIYILYLKVQVALSHCSTPRSNPTPLLAKLIQYPFLLRLYTQWDAGFTALLFLGFLLKHYSLVVAPLLPEGTHFLLLQMVTPELMTSSLTHLVC